MPAPLKSDSREFLRTRRVRVSLRTHCRTVSVLFTSFIAAAALTSCDQKPTATIPLLPQVQAAPTPHRAILEEPREIVVSKPRDVYATWYQVPPDSLAKRRAGLHELTAAHNKLPIGTLVRVTHLANGRSVKVRITDRGIPGRKIKLDVCKEAAEELEMVSKGIARVRMEILREEHGSSAAKTRTAAPEG